MKKVTFKTKTGNLNIEFFSDKPMLNGFIQSANIELRALSLGWIILTIEDVGE